MKFRLSIPTRSLARTRSFRVQARWQTTAADNGTTNTGTNPIPPLKKATAPKEKRAKTKEKPIMRHVPIPSLLDQVVVKKHHTRDSFLGNPTGSISPILLRDACKCSLCVDQSDRQRNFQYASIPPSIAINKVRLSPDGGSVTLTWTDDVPGFPKDHTTTLDWHTIRRMASTHRHPAWELFNRRGRLWTSSTFAAKTSRVDFKDYISSDAALATTLYLLWRDGLVFIDGVPPSSESVTKIVNRMGPLQNTFYGATWDVKSVPDAKNVAYTSKHLGFHMDLLYMKDPPGYQFLHTIDNSCTGGESLFADTFNAVDQLLSKDMAAFETLRNYQVRYEYSNDNFFYSDEKPTLARSYDMRVPPRFFENAQNPAQIRTLAHVFYSPPFVGHLVAGPASSAEQRFVQASRAFEDILNDPKNVVQEKMESGTCVIFDNLRVVHARNAFDINSGKRWLKGAYLTRQDFYSKAVSMLAQMPRGQTGNLGASKVPAGENKRSTEQAE